MLLTTENKFYTHNQVWWACVLGGPLIGCYLVSKNYSNFGQVTFARKVLILGIAISIVLISVLVSLPDHLLHGMPKWLYRTIPLSYTVFWASYVQQFQGIYIKNSKAQGWQKYSARQVLFLSVISLVISIVYTTMLIVLFL